MIDEAVAATCTETGLTEGSHCSVCPMVFTAQQTIPATGHSYKEVAETAPTCTKVGYTAGTVCSGCGDVKSGRDEIPATGHTSVTDAAVAATCTETGLTEGSHCSVCKEVLVAQQEVPANGHSCVKTEAVAPTCTETGNSEYYTCSVCKKYFKLEGGVYTEIEKGSWVLSALGHDWSDVWSSDENSHWHACSRCTERNDQAGHVSVTDEAVAATCTKTGLTEGSHCSVCNEALTAQQTTPATGHTVVTDAAVAATYTETGLTEGSHCSVCHDVLVPQQVVPVLTPTNTPVPTNTPASTNTPVPTNTPAPATNGTIGSITWAVGADGVLTISGTGDIPDDTCPWAALADSITSVVVKEGVTGIGKNVLANLPKVTSITLPKTLTSIGDSAFSGCAALETINIPDSVTTAGTNLFDGCTSGLTITGGPTAKKIAQQNGASFVLEEVPIKVTSSKTLKPGKTVTLKPKQTGLTGVKYTYKSSNKKIAKVDKNGKVTALKKGTATITVTSSHGETAKVKITVKSVKITNLKKSVSLKAGKTLTLKPKQTGTSGAKYTYKTSNKKVAKVSKTGKITAVKAGTCTITVTSSFGETFKIKVTVK